MKRTANNRQARWWALALALSLTIPATLLAVPIGTPGSFKPGPQVINAGDTSSEELPGNVVIDLDVSFGYLWAATGKGLGRFLSNNLAGSPGMGTWMEIGREEGFNGRGGVSAIAGATYNGTDYIVAATATDTVINGESFSVGGGIGYSADYGASWTWMAQPVDDRDETRYEPTTTTILNVTYDLAMQGDTIWAASFGGGLRYYVLSQPDSGWVVRPPDANEFDAAAYRNHLVITVITNDSLLLVGGSAGVNVSRDGGATWTNSKFSSQNSNTISGNWVTAMALQPTGGSDVRIWAVTRATDVAGEYSGVSVSDDLGLTWRRLLGTYEDPVTAHNITVDDSTVYAATDDGLYMSNDGGEVWGLFGPVYDESTEERTWYSEVYSVAVEGIRLWRGGPEGLAVSDDGGLNWALLRTNGPVAVTGAPDAYAYPNPFSPSRHEVVRVRYNMPKAGEVTMEVYDFAMELLVRPVKDRPRLAGDHDEVWNGLGPGGREVANGVYFVRVVGGGEESWTKILLLD